MATTSDRRSWAVRRMSGTVDDIDLALLDPADPDERRLLIEAEHPKLRQSLRDEVEEIVLEGQAMSPRLHITLHEIVAERLWADDPPETWLTAQRLSALGYDRHEVLHMLCPCSARSCTVRCKGPGRRDRIGMTCWSRWQHFPAAGRRSAGRHRRTGPSGGRSSALATAVIADAAAQAAASVDPVFLAPQVAGVGLAS